MNKRIIADVILILALYGVYWMCIYLAVSYDLPQQFEVTPPPGVEEGDFLANFNYWSLVVMGISLLTALSWYVLGAWGPKAHVTRHGTWTLIWLMGLAVVIGSGFIALWFGPQVSEKMVVLALFYFGGGIIFYYLASMLFSHVNVKYEVIGAKVFRRW